MKTRPRGPIDRESAATPTQKVDLSQTDETWLIVVPGPPAPKPRQTSRDRWLNPPRPCVARYRAWADKARSCAGELPANLQCLDLKIFLPIPPSWSKKKREAHRGQPHRVRPDKDNIEKAVADALLKADQCIWKGSQEKRWDDGGGPRVEIIAY